MGFDKAIPADAMLLGEAYWEAARTLLPFMNQPAHSDSKRKRSEAKDRAQFEKRWRLSLAGHDPMTGERAEVELQPFIVHPETYAKLAVVDRWKWLLRDEAVDVQLFVPVSTANSKIDCSILIDRKEFDRWLSTERGFPDAQANAVSKSQAGLGAHNAEPDAAPRRKTEPRKLLKTIELMRADLTEGKLTPDKLKDMLEKGLEDRYCVSRDTARKARKQVLSKQPETTKSTNDS